MAYKVIPVTSDPNQRFECTIPIDGNNVSLLFLLVYNDQGNYWCMTVSDANTSEVLLDTIPLLTSNGYGANILEQYSYKKIGSAYIIKTSNIRDDSPTMNNLGTDFVLMWGDTVG